METYISDIRLAILYFPLVAAICTLPYLVRKYRQYGSVPWLHTIGFFLFVFYIMCAYFLVLLPLPEDRHAVVAYAQQPQLVPFSFIGDLAREAGFSLTDLRTWIALLKTRTFYTTAFNVALLMPLGMFVRYFFKPSWRQMLIVGFGVSLSFELLQLTGLLGYYDHPYRLFDVDDLMTNTAGCMAGYALMAPLMRFLPTMEDVERRAKRLGVRASATQRLLSFGIDTAIWSFLSSILISLTVVITVSANVSSDSSVIDSASFLTALLAGALLFGAVPAFTKGQTLGQKLLKLRIVRPDGSPAAWYQPFLRYASLGILACLPFGLLVVLVNLDLNVLGGGDFLTNLTSGHTPSSTETVFQYAIFIGWFVIMGLLAVQLGVRGLISAVRHDDFVMLNGLITNTRVMTLQGISALREVASREDDEPIGAASDVSASVPGVGGHAADDCYKM